MKNVQCNTCNKEFTIDEVDSGGYCYNCANNIKFDDIDISGMTRTIIAEVLNNLSIHTRNEISNAAIIDSVEIPQPKILKNN